MAICGRRLLIRNLVFYVSLLEAFATLRANASLVVEPFGGYEMGAMKKFLKNPPKATVNVSATGGGFSGGGRLGLKSAKGLWGFGAEGNLASLGASNIGFEKPLDIGIYLVRWWKGGFRVRASYIILSDTGNFSGSGYRAGFGLLLKKHVCLNLDFIYRKLNTVKGLAKTASGKEEMSTGFFSIGFPFGEGAAVKK